MHSCIYCNCKFNSRKQVKNPKACFNSECQGKRQRDNEKNWHAKHWDRFDKRYHRTRRKARNTLIFAMIEKILHATTIGFTMIVQGFDIDHYRAFLQEALPALGLRNANKLWVTRTA